MLLRHSIAIPSDALPTNPIDITSKELYELLTKGYQSEGPQRAATRAYFKHIEGLLETDQFSEIAHTLFALIKVIEDRAVEYNLLTDLDLKVRAQQALQAGYEYVALILHQMFISKPNETVEIIARHMPQQDIAGDSAHTFRIFWALARIKGYPGYEVTEKFVDLFKTKAPQINPRMYVYFDNELEKIELEQIRGSLGFRANDPLWRTNYVLLYASGFLAVPAVLILLNVASWAFASGPVFAALIHLLIHKSLKNGEDTNQLRTQECEALTPRSLKKEADIAAEVRARELEESSRRAAALAIVNAQKQQG